MRFDVIGFRPGLLGRYDGNRKKNSAEKRKNRTKSHRELLLKDRTEIRQKMQCTSAKE
jgi:hypothetical protein